MDRSDQMILPDRSIKEIDIAQHRLLLVMKLLAKFPSAGVEAAKGGPSPCPVKHTAPCLHVEPTSSVHSHCQPMPEEPLFKLQSRLVQKTLNSPHASTEMGLDMVEQATR